MQVRHALLAGLLAALPAGALGQSTVMELHGVRLALSRDEMIALSELGRLALGGSQAAQDRALARARRVATGRDALYVLAVYQLQIGVRRGDDALMVEALDVLLARASAPADRLASWLDLRAAIAYRNGDPALAETLWTRLSTLRPGDGQAMVNLAQARLALDRPAEAATLFRSAITARRTAGEPVSEALYRQWLSVAHNGRLRDEVAEAGRALAAAFPTPANWRMALEAFRQATMPEGAAEIDLLGFMDMAGVLTGRDETVRLAQLLMEARRHGEARALLDRAFAQGRVDPAAPPLPLILANLERALAEPAGAQLATPSDPRAAAVAAAQAMIRAGRLAEARALLDASPPASPPGWYDDLAAFMRLWLEQQPA